MRSTNIWIFTVFSSLIFTACTTNLAINRQPDSLAAITPDSDSHQSGKLKISIDKVGAYVNKTRRVSIKLKVEGFDAKDIKGYKLERSLLSNGEELKLSEGGESPTALARGSIELKERGKWFRSVSRRQPHDPYVKEFVKENIFYVPPIYARIDEAINTVDLKGEITLIVASEENKCLCEVEDFLAEGKLTEQPFEFNGGIISFKEEPAYSTEELNDNHLVHNMVFQVDDLERSLFNVYFKDSSGKERGKSGDGYGHRPPETTYLLRTGFMDEKPDKDWKMVMIYGHENCRQTIPFHFKNIDVSSK